MRNKKTFLLAAILLTLSSAAANADLILTLNGLDTAKEPAEIKGKDNLVIAVAGDTEVEPNAYRIEAASGVLTPRSSAEDGIRGRDYSFTFEDGLATGTVSLIANDAMVIDGTPVKAGDTIYGLILFYIPETDTVAAFGANAERLNCIPLKSKPKPEFKAKIWPERGPVAETGTKTFLPSSKRKPGGTSKLMHLPEVSESLTPVGDGLVHFKDWKQMQEEILASQYFPQNRENIGLSPAVEEETNTGNLPIKPPSYPSLLRSAEAGRMEMSGSSTEFSAGLMDMDLCEQYLCIPADTVITENTVWDSNIIILLGAVEVNNATLIIKPGVDIVIPVGYEGGILVRNNGCLIADGASTPDKMIRFVPTDWEPYTAYYYAIWLDQTASPLCEISHCLIYGAFNGIMNFNHRLETPIHDNIFWNCRLGVCQYGPKLTDVINNEIFNPDYPMLPDPYWPIGIYASLADVCGVDTNTAEILIENNTIYGYQICGINVSGVADANDAGTVVIANNFVAWSYDYAIALINGWMRLLVTSNGYYANSNNINVPEAQESTVLAEEDVNIVAVIEDFNSYGSGGAMTWIWKDRSYQQPQTGAQITVASNPNLVRDGNSMQYEYSNADGPYFAEVWANVADLPSPIDSNWVIGDANTLTLYFYGKAGNDIGEQMYVKLTDGDQNDFYVVDNFDEYRLPGTDMGAIWHESPRAAVQPAVNQKHGIPEPNNWSMWYWFYNTDSPYYAEVNATIGTGSGKLNIGSDWLGMGAEALSLWFYGKSTNDANKPMYITLVDSNTPAHIAKVFYSDYGDMNDIRDPHWHQWNIPLGDFEANNPSINLADVNRIVIGFGDKTPAATDGKVWFDDIRLSKVYPPRPHTAKAFYKGNPYCLKEQWWHVWNIPFKELNDVNLGNITHIAIGFGDGNQPTGSGYGTVFFEDIVLSEGNAPDPYYDNAIYLDEDPLVWEPNDWPYIRPDCNLIDAGAGYIDEYPYLTGKASCRYYIPDTNSYREIPDTNIANIGFHYNFDWDYGYGPPKSDLDGDWVVNFKDFAIFAAGWLTTYDYNDLATMAGEWLETISVNPSIAVTTSGDANNLSGDIGISVTGYSATTKRVFVLMDGDFIGEIVDFDNDGCVGLETSKYDNGQHTIKVVAVDNDGSVTASENVTANFANELYYLRKEGSFKERKDYPIYAMNSSGHDLRVKVVDWNDTVVWTSPTISGNINVVIPESAFSGQIYDLVIEEESGTYGLMAEGGGETWESIWERSIGKEYEPNTSYKFAIFLPTKWAPGFPVPIPYNSANTRKRTVAEIVRVCETKHMPYVILYEGKCTWEKFKSVLSSPGISYVYMVSHGGFYVGPLDQMVQRTFFYLTDSRVLSHYDDSLPETIKKRKDVHYMDSIGLGTIERIKIVHIDACFQTRYIDMADEWMNQLIEEQDGSIVSDCQLFIGWQGEVMLSDDNWDIFSRDIWHWLGEGKNYQQAMGIALQNQEGRTHDLISYSLRSIGWWQVIFNSEGN